jgi:hypothetical protein
VFAAVPLVATGCASDHHGSEGASQTGTLSVPLVTTTNGHTYRLSGYIYYYGTQYGSIYMGDETELTVNLPTGDYTAYLSYYTLERLDDSGNYQPVSGTLVSSYYQQFSIYNRTTTTISFQFETDGTIVTVGAGNLDVNIGVTEVAPVCTVFGSDCPDGTWCPPAELTGLPLACVASGSMPAGYPCNSPSDCAANTSCFDFGTGSVCAALCDATAFETACPGGGTCTEDAKTYGVCVPDGATLPGGGGEGGMTSGVGGSSGFGGRGGGGGREPFPAGAAGAP